VGFVPHRGRTDKKFTPRDVPSSTEDGSTAGSRNVVITYCMEQSAS
jgi:hypothetical protein